MNELDYLQKRDELDVDAEIIHNDEENKHVLFLSEDATRELALALGNYLDNVSPYDVEEQERIDYLYKELMENFAFEKGSYIVVSEFTYRSCGKVLGEYEPRNEDVYTELVDVLSDVQDQFNN